MRILAVRGISNFNVTLYDLFGYLMPGLVAASSLSLLGWALFIPSHPLHEPSLSGTEWIAVLVLAYFLGHLVQAIAEVGFWAIRQEKVANEAVRGVLGEARFAEITRLGRTKTRQVRLPFAYCDTFLAQQGKTTDREIYQYRGDFYRGLTIAILPALAAIVIELFRGSASVRSGVSVHALGRGPLVFALVIVVATVGLSFWRYRRFVEYRILDVVLGFKIDSEIAAAAAKAAKAAKAKS